ncbi:hypothetical protein BO71DRAFT_40031 [Aspergillus ellipticus CBS 707.79]|uniref:Uncharacterized protein n=1 Tax=Aspergillus ellipticus CBS 707.79 TaxID=1448320 RepID=A0A319F1J7_9EURO|nr:hypothetical protein BO71DRAFT_40031 [Aspergillus ellipticus CBS 707.79]
MCRRGSQSASLLASPNSPWMRSVAGGMPGRGTTDGDGTSLPIFRWVLVLCRSGFGFSGLIKKKKKKKGKSLLEIVSRQAAAPLPRPSVHLPIYPPSGVSQARAFYGTAKLATGLVTHQACLCLPLSACLPEDGWIIGFRPPFT